VLLLGAVVWDVQGWLLHTPHAASFHPSTRHALPLSCLLPAPADTLLDILTVEEMLMYTAELKRPISQSREQKQAAVEELIDLLALDGCRAVKIGK
jgi:ABC-type multidrug transport system ATPase subunit